MSTAVGILRLKPVWFTASLVVLILAYQVWIGIGAAAKIADGHLDTPGPIDLAVTLAIDPEQFHMSVLQDAGRLIRVDGRRAFLKDVPAAKLRSLARCYWVAALSRWPGEAEP